MEIPRKKINKELELGVPQREKTIRKWSLESTKEKTQLENGSWRHLNRKSIKEFSFDYPRRKTIRKLEPGAPQKKKRRKWSLRSPKKKTNNKMEFGVPKEINNNPKHSKRKPLRQWSSESPK